MKCRTLCLVFYFFTLVPSAHGYFLLHRNTGERILLHRTPSAIRYTPCGNIEKYIGLDGETKSLTELLTFCQQASSEREKQKLPVSKEYVAPDIAYEQSLGALFGVPTRAFGKGQSLTTLQIETNTRIEQNYGASEAFELKPEEARLTASLHRAQTGVLSHLKSSQLHFAENWAAYYATEAFTPTFSDGKASFKLLPNFAWREIDTQCSTTYSKEWSALSLERMMETAYFPEHFDSLAEFLANLTKSESVIVWQNWFGTTAHKSGKKKLNAEEGLMKFAFHAKAREWVHAKTGEEHLKDIKGWGPGVDSLPGYKITFEPILPVPLNSYGLCVRSVYSSLEEENHPPVDKPEGVSPDDYITAASLMAKYKVSRQHLYRHIQMCPELEKELYLLFRSPKNFMTPEQFTHEMMHHLECHLNVGFPEFWEDFK